MTSENGKPVDHNGEYATDVHGEQAAVSLRFKDKSKLSCFISLFSRLILMEAPGIKR